MWFMPFGLTTGKDRCHRNYEQLQSIYDATEGKGSAGKAEMRQF